MRRVETVETSQLEPWLEGQTLADWRERFDRDGYVVFERVLDAVGVKRIHDALQPHLGADVAGRNVFEGFYSNRVYNLLSKSPVFGDLITHPLPLAFAEADLGESCLISALLAINLKPGETSQPWHYDDSHIMVARPRPSFGVSAFWTLNDTTNDNGATEVIPGSHLWGDFLPDAATKSIDFVTSKHAGQQALRATDPDYVDTGARSDAVKVTMPAGSLMLAKGTLWHRGGPNRSDSSRLIVTPQYCPGWARQLENIMAVTPRHVAASYPKRVRQLIGYSIHSSFMGYVDGVHPDKLLDLN